MALVGCVSNPEALPRYVQGSAQYGTSRDYCSGLLFVLPVQGDLKSIGIRARRSPHELVAHVVMDRVNDSINDTHVSSRKRLSILGPPCGVFRLWLIGKQRDSVFLWRSVLILARRWWLRQACLSKDTPPIIYCAEWLRVKLSVSAVASLFGGRIAFRFSGPLLPNRVLPSIAT